MKKWPKTLVGGALVIGSLVPASVVSAAPRHAPATPSQATTQCSGDQTRLRLHDCTCDQNRVRLQDGTRDQTRLRLHDCTCDQNRVRLQDGTGKVAVPNSPSPGPSSGYQHMSGPQDGTGPQADRPLDGTGNQWGRVS